MCLNQGETNSAETGRGIKQGCCQSCIIFNLYGGYFIKEAIAEVKDFKIWGKIINLRFLGDVAIIGKIQEELQNMVNRLVDTEKKYGMEITGNELQFFAYSFFTLYAPWQSAGTSQLGVTPFSPFLINFFVFFTFPGFPFTLII